MISSVINAIGARILKTGLAVSLAVYICTILNLEPKVFSAVSAVINVQPSIFRSFRNALDQILTHLISVVIAVACGYSLGSNPLIMGLSTILIISVNVKLKLLQGVAMGVVAGIFVLDAPQHEFLNHALTRSYVVFVGLGAALAVNGLLPQPRYGEILSTNLSKLNVMCIEFFEELVRRFVRLEPMISEEYENRRVQIKHQMRVTRTQFELYKEQNKYLRQTLGDNETWEKYLDFNTKLFFRSQEIYSATQQRLDWRLERGDPPISAEFQMVLGMLERGMDSVVILNTKLYRFVFYGDNPAHVPINEQFWEELSYFIDEWHAKLTGAHFLHVFMYVSVVANDIKWASRSIKEFPSLKNASQAEIEDK